MTTTVVETETLEFESAHFLQSLFANDEALLKVLQKKLGVHVTTRDGWLRFEGGTKGVGEACSVFRELEKVRRDGAEIDASAFRFVLDSRGASKEGEGLSDMKAVRVLGSSTRPPVSPRTLNQLRYLRAIDTSTVTFGVGPAGTGKTYLAVAKALAALKNREVNRVVLARPAVEAGEALGFLPGDLQEKIAPYLRPLYDAIYDMLEPGEVEKYIEKNMIEIAPLAYMRGRTLHRSFIILDEAQNTTEEQMLMFLTRLGEGAKCVVTGDPSQVDLRRGLRSGLREAQGILRDVNGVSLTEFGGVDVVRHPVVRRIIAAYDSSRGRENTPE